MCLSLAAARKYALIICMRLLAVLHTCAIYGIQITASLSDKDAVYLIESVVGGLHICEGYDPLLFSCAFKLYAKTETMTVLLHAFSLRA